MNDTIAFIKNSIPKSVAAFNKLSPASAKHLIIRDGSLSCWNGDVLSMCPCPFTIEANPEAFNFIRLLEAIGENSFTIKMTPTKRVSIKSNKVKGVIDCLGSVEHIPTRATDTLDNIDGELFIATLKKLRKFVADDSNSTFGLGGITMLKGMAYATNNKILSAIYSKFGFKYPVSIPMPIIDELIKLNELPTTIGYSKSHIIFYFNSVYRLKSSKLYITRQLNINEVFKNHTTNNPFIQITPELIDSVNKVKNFAEDSIEFAGDVLRSGDIHDNSNNIEVMLGVNMGVGKFLIKSLGDVLSMHDEFSITDRGNMILRNKSAKQYTVLSGLRI